MQTMDRYNHPDADIMSLLQSIELVEGILKTHRVTNVRDLPWNGCAIVSAKRSKLHKVDAPTIREFKTVSFMLADDYDWDHRARLMKGDDPRIRATMKDDVLLKTAGSAWNPELEDTDMFQTDSRDRAADRDAETYDDQRLQDQ